MANTELLEDIEADGDLEQAMLEAADAASRTSGDGPADVEGEVFDLNGEQC